MELYAKIITDDKRFERMLSLELSDCGIKLVSEMESFSKKLTEENFFTIVDLDLCREDISELCVNSKVIGFARADKCELGQAAETCHAFFHRPFLMSEFLAEIFDDDKLHRSRNARERSSISAARRERRESLTLDRNGKCILYGKERIPLTDSELKVISLLYEKRGISVSREEISSLLGADNGNICDVYICMLRRKLDNRFGMKFISTVRGSGYMLK